MTRSRGSLGRRIAGAALSGIVAIGLLELSFRAFGPYLPGSYRTGVFIREDAQLGWSHIPGAVMWQRTPEFTVRVEINEQGRRGPFAPDRPSVGRVRAVLLGDSFTEGAQLPYESAFATLLGARASIEAVNEGVSGYGTDQELLVLEQRALALHPDVVLVVMTVTDVFDNDWSLSGPYADIPKPHFDLDERTDALVLRPMRAAQPLSDRLRTVLAGSALANVVKTGVLDRFRAPALAGAQRTSALDVLLPPQGEWERAWRITDALVRRIAAETASAGTRALLVVVPDACQIRADDCGGRRELAASDVPQRRLAAAAQGAGLPMIDLLPGFRAYAREHDDRLYFARDLHWNATGQDLGATIVARELAETISALRTAR